MSKKKIVIISIFIVTILLLGGCTKSQKDNLIEAESEIACNGQRSGITVSSLAVARKNGEISKDEVAQKMKALKEEWNEVAKKYGFKSWTDMNKQANVLNQKYKNLNILIDQRVKEKCVGY